MPSNGQPLVRAAVICVLSTACGARSDVAASGATASSSSGGGDPCPSPCAGCSVQHVWSKGIDGPATVASVAATDDGFVVAGRAGSTIDLGGGPLTSPGTFSILVARMRADGSHVWSKVFGDADSQMATAVAVDHDGSVVLTGFSSGAVDFGGGPVAGKFFLVKLGTMGDHFWSRGFPSSHDPTGGGDVAIDATGNVVVVGTFSGSIDLGGGPLASKLSEDVFIARFDPAGTLLWSKALTTMPIGVPQVAIDGAGKIRLAAKFSGAVDFGGKSASGTDGVLLATLTKDGDVLHSRALTADDVYFWGDLAIDASGDSVLTGAVAGTVDLGAGPVEADGIFLAKYGPAEEYIWSKTFGGEISGSVGVGLALDDEHNIVVSARSRGADFGGGPLPVQSKYGDIAVAKLDPCGAHISSKSFGAASTFGAGAITLGPDGELFVAGDYDPFSGPVDFGGGPLGSPISSGIYLTKLRP